MGFFCRKLTSASELPVSFEAVPSSAPAPRLILSIAKQRKGQYEDIIRATALMSCTRLVLHVVSQCSKPEPNLASHQLALATTTYFLFFFQKTGQKATCCSVSCLKDAIFLRFVKSLVHKCKLLYNRTWMLILTTFVEHKLDLFRVRISWPVWSLF